jgi:Domain of unknown function (DUF4365)
METMKHRILEGKVKEGRVFFMSKVDRNRSKGNYAQHFASLWLSRACLVRPVAEGTDIGIDLYCESLMEHTPFLHFWVQVKAITVKVTRKTNADKVVAFDFETKHLQYWKRQPIPVYAFIVCITKWPPADINTIHVIQISKWLVQNDIPDQRYVRIESSYKLEADSLDAGIDDFTTRIVPWDTAFLLLQKGIVSPIPHSLNPDRLHKHMLVGLEQQHFELLLENTRDASVIGLMEALRKKHDQHKHLAHVFMRIPAENPTRLRWG